MWFLLSGIFLFIIAYLAGEISPYKYSGRSLAQEFESVLHNKEIVLHDHMNDLKEEFERDSNYIKLWDFFIQQVPNLDEEGLGVYVYLKDTLACWSDNSISVPDTYNDSLFNGQVIFLSNAWFISKSIVDDNVRFIGLIMIKKEYGYENKYLENHFQKDFKVPANTNLVIGSSSSIKIHDVTGNNLFSLDISAAPSYSSSQLYFSLICYFTSLILLTLFLRRLLTALRPEMRQNIGALLFALCLFLLYVLVSKILLPGQLRTLGLFGPEVFAVSGWFTSLADLLSWSYLLYLAVYTFYSDFRIREEIILKNTYTVRAIMIGYMTGLIFFFQYIIMVFQNLVYHSNISFLTYKVLDIDIHTFLGLLILAFHFAAFALLADKFISLFRPSGKLLTLGLWLVFFGTGVWLTGTIMNHRTDLFMNLFILIIIAVIAFKRYFGSPVYKYSTYVLLVCMFSILTVFEVINLSGKKLDAQMKVISVDLSAENDPVAELLLKDIEKNIKADTVLSSMMTSPVLDESGVYNYVVTRYFQGFWEKYDFQVTLCGPRDSLYVGHPVDSLYHCYDFFKEMIDSNGIRISGSGFYSIDDLNGRIYYLSLFPFWSPDSTVQITMFLELNSRFVSEELGYPELLLTNEFNSKDRDEDLSLARYNNKELVTQSGPYSYSLLRDMYTNGEAEFEYIRKDRHRHLVYNPDKDNTVIVSRPEIKWLDVLISFTYIFVFFYICVSSNLLILFAPFFRNSFNLNIKNKIQYSLILILVLSLLTIGAGSIYFSVRQYKIRQNTGLTERIQSVWVELMQKLQYEEELSYDWQSDDYENLDDLLRKFSNVFYTDIHLFSGSGDLIATSRPEIFDKGLQGMRIQPEAFFKLAIDRRNEFVHEERIGSLKFLSAYIPFVNSKNHLLAYLNLPYFTKQDTITRDIANLVVGIVNFYVLLITLSVVVAVFISVRITQPLEMIQGKFGKITLGKTNEKINYNSDDEIGNLVKEYNHMVDQLAESAEKLARSERESAWREMAKQIAHEIKNPLTPMKLSVQHLQRAWKDNPENWEQNLERISQTLVEQIDNLSAIATEFSNFAKMPGSDNVKVNLGNKIAKTVALFEKTENVAFITEYRNTNPVIVLADKEQLSSVFINLIKNAIQSIPENRPGLIRIQLDTSEGKAIVRINDNGKGIPEELGDKLFQPNFTTKSSGMGLGLAIVKNIIDNTGGRIRYETELNKGTTFIVELPLVPGGTG